MKNWGFYRFLLQFLPAKGKINASDLPPDVSDAAEHVLRAFSCVGASLCLFDETGVTSALGFGVSHAPDTPAQPDTVYRAASVSKFVTAMGAMT